MSSNGGLPDGKVEFFSFDVNCHFHHRQIVLTIQNTLRILDQAFYELSVPFSNQGSQY